MRLLLCSSHSCYLRIHMMAGPNSSIPVAYPFPSGSFPPIIYNDVFSHCLSCRKVKALFAGVAKTLGESWLYKSCISCLALPTITCYARNPSVFVSDLKSLLELCFCVALLLLLLPPTLNDITCCNDQTYKQGIPGNQMPQCLSLSLWVLSPCLEVIQSEENIWHENSGIWQASANSDLTKLFGMSHTCLMDTEYQPCCSSCLSRFHWRWPKPYSAGHILPPPPPPLQFYS